MLCVAEKHIAFTTKKWFYNIRTLKLNLNAFSRQKKNPFPTIHPFYQQKKKFSNFSNYIITPISKSSPIKKKKKTYIHPVTITTDSSIPNLPIILVSFTIFQHNDFPPSLCTPRVEPPAAAHAQLTAMRQPWGNDCNTIYYDTPHPPTQHEIKTNCMLLTGSARGISTARACWCDCSWGHRAWPRPRRPWLPAVSSPAGRFTKGWKEIFLLLLPWGDQVSSLSFSSLLSLSLRVRDKCTKFPASQPYRLSINQSGIALWRGSCAAGWS